VRRFSAGASARGIVGPAPRIMPGLGVELLFALDRDSIWSPALRLAGAHHGLSRWMTAGGTANFTLDTAQIDACALRLGLGRLSLRGCATGVAGRLTASGADTFEPESHARFYAAAGGTALLALGLGDRVEITGSVGVLANLVRDAFEFTEVFHKVPAVTTALGLGAALTFP
jgi:hypothetical protein